MLTAIDLLPAKLILSLASRYMAGKDEIESMSLAHNLFRESKFTSTLDILGESASSAEQCQNYVDTYIRVIDMVSEDPLPAQEKQKQLTISFKPSMFCVCESTQAMPSGNGFEDGYKRIERVVKYAFKRGVSLTLEAEDSRWTDFHLDSYFSLLNSGYTNLGTVLQSRLLRTEKDLNRFDGRARVRLVTGIYQENPEVAYQDKKQIKQLLITYGRLLLEKGAYLELATHDETYIRKFFSEVAIPLRINSSRFETQFLFGVPRIKLLKALACGQYFDQWKAVNDNMADQLYLESLERSGVIVRLYLPFGSDEVAAPYCKRRLKTNPNLLLYGIKNLIGIQ